MLEYVFFDPKPRDEFLEKVNALGVISECCQKGDELLVLLSDELDSDMLDLIEGYYELTFQMSEALMAEAEGVEHFNLAGVEVNLKSGPVIATVDAKLLAKLMSVLDCNELGRFVDSIARAVEEPDLRPLCKR